MRRGILAVVSVVVLCTVAHAQSGRPNPGRGPAIEAMIGSTGEEPLRKFAAEHLAPDYRQSFASEAALIAHLEKIRVACANFGGVMAGPADGGGTQLTFMRETGDVSVRFRLEESGPYRIVALDLEGGARRPPGVEIPPITWDTLEKRLDEESAAGFAGTVLVVRGGKVVLHRSYGMADRERKMPNTTETVFAIGSVPIDFTKAAILKLAESGKLRMTDSIGRFLSGVPADKRAMTIEHLMTRRSGLPNFHHEPTDADKDLSWIDRSTAVRRILAKPLLFAPGTGEEHSHSAWVLLAAIVEIVSREPYGQYLKKNFFAPAGMTRTGNHEDMASLPDDAFAVGYGPNSAGKRNTPKYWGKTSWLVMGSGGMESNPGDLNRWLEAIQTGKTLSPESARRYLVPGVFAGGDDRGFLCLYNQGGEDRMILCTNVHTGPGDRASAVGRKLVDLVSARAPN